MTFDGFTRSYLTTLFDATWVCYLMIQRDFFFLDRDTYTSPNVSYVRLFLFFPPFHEMEIYIFFFYPFIVFKRKKRFFFF